MAKKARLSVGLTTTLNFVLGMEEPAPRAKCPTAFGPIKVLERRLSDKDETQQWLNKQARNHWRLVGIVMKAYGASLFVFTNVAAEMKIADYYRSVIRYDRMIFRPISNSIRMRPSLGRTSSTTART